MKFKGIIIGMLSTILAINSFAIYTITKEIKTQTKLQESQALALISLTESKSYEMTNTVWEDTSWDSAAKVYREEAERLWREVYESREP